ncbi:zinc finger Y-chromosomal protein 1-like [Phymastichus coffea]|uniref:zinc finger Y-chromosomal protein 1-like n=1 Tax=Phymastichus coffea TaxID=108790 RepID=UPI00273C157C|nr:zinc finger Y-chromosomal protein 1-like [Phymastichus coffea]XP_058807295.1 zinc finger Y-chromosomal protein 1-like [Phymastichus coffea]
MDEKENNLQTHCNGENSYKIRQLSDGLQRIDINQIDYYNGLGTSESLDATIGYKNNDFQVTINLNEECQFKNKHHTLKNTVDTDVNMLLEFGEGMENQNSMESFIGSPKSNNEGAKALKKETCHEANQQGINVQSAKIKYHSSEHANVIKSRSYQSYSNLITKYCFKCKLISKNIVDWKCSNCQLLLQFKCKKCSSVFKNYIGILNHIKCECYTLPTYYCPICNYNTYSKVSLIRHTQTEHSLFDESEYSHRCSTCKKKFKEQHSLLRHQKMCENKLNLICQYCPYKTNLHHLLIQHIQKKHHQHVISCHKCPGCDKKYKDSRTLHLHMKFTCNVKQFFQCDHCHFKTDNKFSLVRHVQEVHH